MASESAHGRLDCIERRVSVDDAVGKSQLGRKIGARPIAVDGDDAAGIRQPRAHHGGKSHWPRADNGHGRALLDVGETRTPPARRQNVAEK